MSDHVVAVAAFPDVELLDIAGPLQVLSTATRLGAQPAYRTIILGPTNDPVRCADGTRLEVDGSWRRSRGRIDTLLVPGGTTVSGRRVEALVPDDLVSWLQSERVRSIGRLVSVCAGAHVLAAAGLLDGRRATTHWATAGTLRVRHPKVAVDADALHVQDGHVWTSAGVTAGSDLALALVAEDCGEPMAREVARWLVMYLRRPGGQQQFASNVPAARASDPGLAELQRWIAKHLDRDLSVAALAARIHQSPRHFARRFRSDTGTTPADYVEQLRCEAAAHRLSTTDRPVLAVARSVGFGSVETFHRVFRNRYGVTPAEYRQRFSSP
ncbi:MAG: GlxA family transcriptional regulator [Acidimicrobiia bacterium]